MAQFMKKRARGRGGQFTCEYSPCQKGSIYGPDLYLAAKIVNSGASQEKQDHARKSQRVPKPKTKKRSREFTGGVLSPFSRTFAVTYNLNMQSASDLSSVLGESAQGDLITLKDLHSSSKRAEKMSHHKAVASAIPNEITK